SNTVTLPVLAGCPSIAAGDGVRVAANDTANPVSTSAGDVVSVSTSSDTVAANTPTYSITAAQALASPSVSLSSTAAGATHVTYTVAFTTSSTGALVPGYGTITLAAPAGTAFSTNGGNYLITDTTTSLSCSLNNTPFPS